MATKKQKRAAAMAKREQFLAEVKATGLKAQREDQEFRKRKHEQLMMETTVAELKLLEAAVKNGKGRKSREFGDMSTKELEETVKVYRSALAVSH